MTDKQAYEKLCVGCCFEKQCHESMDYCDAFLEATEEATTVRKSRTVQEEADE